MFCKNCGQEIVEGMSFCVNCGASADAQPQAPEQPVYEQPNYNQQAGYGQQPNFEQPNFNQPYYGQPNPNNFGNKMRGFAGDKKRLGIIVGAVVVVIAGIILLCTMCGAGGMDRPLKSMEKAFKNGDASALLDAVLPSEAHSTFYTVEGVSQEDMQEMQEGLGEISEYVSSISMKITDEGQTASSMDAEDCKSELAKYGVNDVQEVKTNVVVEMSITASYMGQSQTQSDTMECTFYKTGGKWYIAPSDINHMM